MNVSVDAILKLISEFSITLIFCAVGSWTRAIIKSSKNQEKIDIKEIIASVVFSAFLMCSCAQYLHFPFEVYATISIICGMWGKVFINLLVSDTFIHNFFTNIAKLITSPVIKEVVKTTTEVMENENITDSKIDGIEVTEETTESISKDEQLPDNVPSTLDK